MKSKIEYNNKNCIVTGGSGFIGQQLVNKLISLGANVYVIDDFSFGATKSSVNPKAVVVIGDVRDPMVFKDLPNKKYDFFFHFAAPSSIVIFKDDLVNSIDITVNGFINALKFCGDNKVRLIYPSTGSVYSGTKPPQSEAVKIELSSLNSYARTKLYLEFIHKSLRELDAIGLRIFAGYGPQEKHKGKFASVVYLFCKDMIRGESPVIFGDGSQVRDFIYIDDVVHSIVVLAQNCKEPIVNIGSGVSTSFNDIIEIVNKKINTNIAPTYVDKPGMYLEKTQADISILSKYYEPEYSIEHGISKIIESINK